MRYSRKILEEAQNYVEQYLLENLPPEILFHNFKHTVEIAEVCDDLAEKEELDEVGREALQLAALFLNMGYTENPENPLRESAKLARKFLEEHHAEEKQIDEVESIILSITTDGEPQKLVQKILHDAYWSFLGRKRFFRRAKLLRLEKERLEDVQYTLHGWEKKMLKLQINTKFLTASALKEYTKRKNKNIAKQKKNILKAHKKSTRKKTGKDFGRGVDTVYRITLRNHIDLSSIADGKANMIISINTLVLSILITAVSAGFSLNQMELKANTRFIAPVLILIVSALAAIIFAVLSVVPKVSGDDFTMEDVKKHKVSLLFFGNFLKFPKEKFVDYLRDLKKDQELLYDDLSRDLYNLGVVLRKKYKLLNIAYRVFVGGLVLSVLAFLISIILIVN